MAALACGLLGPFTLGLGCLLGFALGVAALRRIRDTGGGSERRKLAVAGILASLICMPMSLFVAMPVVARLFR
jgi:hypothetical protein